MPIDDTDAIWSWLFIPVLLVPVLILVAGAVALLAPLWPRLRSKTGIGRPARRSGNAARAGERQREAERAAERENWD